MALFSNMPAAGQPDLFGRPLLSGLKLAPDFFSAAEEQALIGCLREEDLRPFRFQPWTGKRVTRSYGWSYDFEHAAFARADPMPVWLEPVRARAARFAGLDPVEFVQALLIRYDPGAGIATDPCSNI